MGFFKQFPRMDYDIFDNTTKVVDLFRNVDLNETLSDDVIAYQYVDIINGERPDNLSQRLYGRPDYYWTFFIVNDELKDALHDWPLSAVEFEQHMEIKYDNRAAFLLKPIVTSTPFNLVPNEGDTELLAPEGTLWMSNNIGGLDLSYTYLRVSRNGATAKIESWDASMLLLNVYDIDDPELFLADGDYPIVLELSDDYIIDAEWVAWIRSLCTWYSNQLIDELTDTSRLPSSVFAVLESTYIDQDELENALYLTFTDNIGFFTNLELISFTPLVIYDDLRQGPNYYVDSNYDVISAYVATGGNTDQTVPSFVSNYEHETAINDMKSKIKIIKSQFIDEFADQFKAVLNG